MNDKILLAHGSGGRLSHDLIKNTLLRMLGNPMLNRLDDSAVFDINGRLAFTTDSYVVSPLFFPGGDIGKLAVCGTVNDLSMAGAEPLYLSLSLIIEEGFSLDQLERVIRSVQETAAEAGVTVVTGDTKVVNRGAADSLFINTAGVGIVPADLDVSSSGARIGDKVILSGPIGDHGIALISQRESLTFESPVESDCAPLNTLVKEVLQTTPHIHCLRDPTRGGLASTLNEFAESSGVGVRIKEDKLPIKKTVLATCELMGFDPLYIANEGKLVAVVDSRDAEAVLQRIRENPYGREAEIIGEIVEDHSGRVIMETRLGTSRIIDLLSGELLPRIC